MRLCDLTQYGHVCVLIGNVYSLPMVYRVPGQPRLHSDILSLKTNNNNKKIK